MTDAERIRKLEAQVAAQELKITQLQLEKSRTGRALDHERRENESNRRHIGRLQRQLRDAAYDPAEALFAKPKGQKK